MESHETDALCCSVVSRAVSKTATGNLPGNPSVGALGRRPELISVLLLMAVLAVAYFNIIFLGQSLSATANYHPFDYRWDLLKANPAAKPSITNWHDLGGVWWQWEPAASFFSRQYRSGRVPLWDPSLACGVDTHTGLVQGQYYPPSALVLLLGNTPALRDAYYLAELFVAGLFCYLLMRRNGCAEISGVCMGVCYMLSGALTQTINSILGQAFAVLPLMVWSADYAVSKRSWRGTAVTALLLALCALSSFLPVVISGFLLFALYTVIAAGFERSGVEDRVFDWRRSARAVWPPALASIMAVGMLAFLLLPVQLASSRDPSFAKWYPGSGLHSFQPELLLTLISPSISFDIWQSPSLSLFGGPANDIGFFYVGLAPIILAFLARPGQATRRRKLFFFSLAGSVIWLAKLLGLPPIQWMAYLPVLTTLHFVPYFGGALNFCIAGLAGLGVETLIRRRSTTSIGIAVLVTIGCSVAVARFVQTHPVNPALQNLALWGAAARSAMEGARLGAIAIGVVVVLFLRQRGLGSRQTGMLLLALISIELVSLACRPRFYRSDVWEQVPKYVSFLQSDRDLFRVHGVHPVALTPNVSQGLGLSVISSRLPFNPPRFSDLINTYFTAAPAPYPLPTSLLPKSRVILDLLNVKYLVTVSPTASEESQLVTAGLVPALTDGAFRLYRNPAVWPRAYMARVVRPAAEASGALAALAGLQKGDAVVEGFAGGNQVLPEGTVDSIRHDLDTIIVRLHSAGPGLLVLDENASPGWQATVQGTPVPIYPANYAFQAVQVPAGVSEVRFRYRTPGLAPGLVISAIILAGAIYMLLLPGFGRAS